MKANSLFVSGLALALAAGCTLEKTEDVDQFREAVPSADAVAVDGPDTTGTNGRKVASGARAKIADLRLIDLWFDDAACSVSAPGRARDRRR